jgi:nicotinamidase/pyrazinamidase
MLRPADALILVDVQQDFCPGGALPIEAGDAVIPVLNAWIAAAVEQHVPVFASRDWHPLNHLSFTTSGGPWPVHCVQATPGAAFHHHLDLPDDVVVVTKGDRADRDQYSAFDGTRLEAELRDRKVQRIFIGGLAQDVCVRATALDGVKAGFETHVIEAGTRPVSRDQGSRSIAEMREAGVIID